ncbi:MULTISPECIES: hypothetical protein [unclassified Sphingomonas]|uniref:hypothetical protein n=1 Tax=unclassified Sphingomonas TaxID=196159 RepID=UPI002269C817|nr:MULTISPECIES: hypothetical protein [unclassified Sphingomonas]
MTSALPAERVAHLLLTAGYRRLAEPLQVAGLAFSVAGAFVGGDRSADLVVIGDMATSGERGVVQQIEGIARALDVVRSHRPLTSVIVGPRPIGKALEALSQVSRVLAVEEAGDEPELRDRLAILLPIELPASLGQDRDVSGIAQVATTDDPFVAELIQASALSEAAVRRHFHDALMGAAASPATDEQDPSE